MRSLRLLATVALGALAACGPSQAGRAARGPGPTAGAAAPVASAAPAREPTRVDAPASAEAVAEARHLLGRLAFGSRPGEAELIARSGKQRWFEEQLAGPCESPLLEAALVPYKAAFAPPAELVDDWLGDGWESETRTLRAFREETKQHYREHLQRLVTAELTRDILSARQLEAVMTDFWANHFNVYASKGYVRLFEGDYLERALRPNALGKFSELLLATARHPAMLLYLDNAQSRKETGGMASGKRRGLNENYARELLELHTLGVDGGYTQRDVTEVARVLTGWSVEQLRQGKLEFVFRPSAHDRGEKTVLGRKFPAGGSRAEGEQLLEMLARHPSTAQHLARRLCMRFVADQPPASCVSAAAQAFLSSDGDIKQVLRAIFDDASFWAPAARGSKLKTPLELLASTARALGARPDGGLSAARILEQLGEPLLQERVPTGYPDSEPEWSSGGGMLARMSFATQLGERRLKGLSVPWDEVFPAGADGAVLVNQLGLRLLGAGPDSATVKLVREQVESLPAPATRRAAALALLVGSPEFQRQ